MVAVLMVRFDRKVLALDVAWTLRHQLSGFLPPVFVSVPLSKSFSFFVA
jgi:hypothetical protein